MWPLWGLQVFGMSKSFSANPVIGSTVLNKLGLHAARASAAHAMAKLRWALLAWQVPPELRKSFQAQGFCGYSKLPARCTVLKRWTAKSRSQEDCEVRECIQGDTLTHRILLDDQALERLPGVTKLLDHPLFEPLLTYCSANRKRPLHYIQSIKNGAADGKQRSAKGAAFRHVPPHNESLVLPG